MAGSRTGAGRHGMNPGTWIGGGVFLLCACAARLFAGSPLPLLHSLGDTPGLPPLWLLGLLFLSSFFLMGCAAGHMAGQRGGGPVREVRRLRGFLYCVLGTAAALLWYPLLFARASLWLSMPVLLAAVCAAAASAVSWASVGHFAAAAASGCALEWLTLLIVQLLTVLGR